MASKKGADDGDDDEILMACLEQLEDLLYEEVAFDDGEDGDEWNQAASKTSENARSEIDAVVMRAVRAFQDGSSVSGEYPLELTDIHREYAELVEGLVEQRLVNTGCSARQLCASIQVMGWVMECTCTRPFFHLVTGLLLDSESRRA